MDKMLIPNGVHYRGVLLYMEQLFYWPGLIPCSQLYVIIEYVRESRETRLHVLLTKDIFQTEDRYTFKLRNALPICQK